MHGKIPRNGNWKVGSSLDGFSFPAHDAWKNPKERELKGIIICYLSPREVLMHGKIPRNGNWKPYWERYQLSDIFRDAWKNPKERELKVKPSPNMLLPPPRCMEKSQGTGIERTFLPLCDRWNPLKMHGKIPRNGNWKMSILLASDFLTMWRCMEKSQGTGIESLYLLFHNRLSFVWCMEKSQGTGIERMITVNLQVVMVVLMHGKIPRNGNWKSMATLLNCDPDKTMHGKIPRNGNWK